MCAWILPKKLEYLWGTFFFLNSVEVGRSYTGQRTYLSKMDQSHRVIHTLFDKMIYMISDLSHDAFGINVDSFFLNTVVFIMPVLVQRQLFDVVVHYCNL